MATSNEITVLLTMPVIGCGSWELQAEDPENPPQALESGAINQRLSQLARYQVYLVECVPEQVVQYVASSRLLPVTSLVQLDVLNQNSHEPLSIILEKGCNCPTGHSRC